MATNLFLLLDDARTWMSSRTGATLTLSFGPQKELTAQGVFKSGDEEDQVELFQATISDLDLQKSLVDPVPEFGKKLPVGDLTGALFQRYLSSPIGIATILAALPDDQNSITQTVISKATSLRATLAKGGSIDPWPTVVPPVEDKPRVNFLKPSA